jgi:hypothetical protein
MDIGKRTLKINKFKGEYCIKWYELYNKLN